MSGVKLAKFARGYPQVLEEDVRKIEWRQQVSLRVARASDEDAAKRVRLWRRRRLLAVRPLVSERAASGKL